MKAEVGIQVTVTHTENAKCVHFHRGFQGGVRLLFDVRVQMKSGKNFIAEDSLEGKNLGAMDHRGLLKYYQVN